MKIKLFENYTNKNFDITLKESDVKIILDFKHRIELLSDMEFERKYDIDPATIMVDWAFTSMEDLNDGRDDLHVELSDVVDSNRYSVVVPKYLIYNPKEFEEYFDSKRFNL